MKKVLFYTTLILALSLNAHASNKNRVINSGENEHLLNMLESAYWVKKGNTSNKKVYIVCTTTCPRCDKFETTMKNHKDVEFRVLYTSGATLNTQDKQLRKRKLKYNADVLGQLSLYYKNTKGWQTPIAIIPAKEGILYTAVDVFAEDQFTYESFKKLKNKIIATNSKKYQDVSDYVKKGVVVQKKLPVAEYGNHGEKKIVYTYPSENSAVHRLNTGRNTIGKYTLDSNFSLPYAGVVVSEKPEWVKIDLQSNNSFGYVKDPIFAEAVSTEYEMRNPSKKHFFAKKRTEVKGVPSVNSKTIYTLKAKKGLKQKAILHLNGRPQWVKVEVGKDYYGYINLGKGSSKPVESKTNTQARQVSPKPGKTKESGQAKRHDRSTQTPAQKGLFTVKMDGVEDVKKQFGKLMNMFKGSSKSEESKAAAPVQQGSSKPGKTRESTRTKHRAVSPKPVEPKTTVPVKRAASKPVERKKIVAKQVQQTDSGNSSSGSFSGLKSTDVVGVRLGMTIKEAASALKKKYPAYSNFPVTYKAQGQQWAGIYLSLPAELTKDDNIFDAKADEAVAVDFASPPLKQEVLAVSRYKSFPKDKTPSLAVMEGSLMGKYGQWDKIKKGKYENIYYWGGNPKTGSSCISRRLIDPSPRFNDLVKGDSLNAIMCQNYGNWGTCIKQVSKYFKFNPSLKECGVQGAAYVCFNNKGSKDISPVTEIVTFVVDTKMLFASETAFAELGKNHKKAKNLKAIKSAEVPDL